MEMGLQLEGSDGFPVLWRAETFAILKSDGKTPDDKEQLKIFAIRWQIIGAPIFSR